MLYRLQKNTQLLEQVHEKKNMLVLYMESPAKKQKWPGYKYLMLKPKIWSSDVPSNVLAACGEIR